MTSGVRSRDLPPDPGGLPPTLVWRADRTGRWTHARSAGARFAPAAADLLGDGWRAAVHPDEREAVAEAIRRALDTAGPYAIEHRVLTPDGLVHRVSCRAVPVIEGGVLSGHSGVWVDLGAIGGDRRVGEARGLLDTIIDCAPVGFALYDREMRHVRVNDAFAEVTGMPAEAHVGRRPMELASDVSAEPMTAAFRRVLESEEAVGDVELSGETTALPGVPRHWLSNWYPVREDGAVVGVGVFVSDITSRVRAQRGITLLSDVGEALDATLGVDERLARLADILVPEMADFCTFDALGSDGEPRLAACAHVRPEGERALRDLRAMGPLDPAIPLAIARVLALPMPELIDVAPQELERLAALPGGDAIRALAPRSIIVAPIIARGRILGALTLGTGPSGRRYDQEHLALARQLARRSGLALDNARLYDEQRHIAQTLQRSLLPPDLPQMPGLEAAARFSPMGDGIEVGGDFYDVFGAGESWIAAIGDVCGKGAEAAALTSLARHGIRVLGRDDPAPSAVLSDLNDVIVRERGLEPRFSTAAYARLRPGAGAGVRVTVSTAGHPLPLILRADGRVESIGEAGTLLGPFPTVRVHDHDGVLGPGDAIVLYTDGAIEARREGELFGEERLRETLSRHAGEAADVVAGAIEAAVVAFHGGPLADDLAVVVIRVAAPLR